MTDFELLNEYAARGSEDAFTTLTKRYVDLVYSAAMRQTSNPHNAEEITQAVFLVLARKAKEIREDTILSAWLLRTARFVALNAWRRESRRMKLELSAMNLYSTETESAWKQIAPVLDEAMVGLSAKDRDALALRFFEEKSFKEIGQTLGTSEDGAQKRVARAVDRLRANLVKSGAVLSATLIVSALAGRTVQAAPAKALGSAITAVFSGGMTPASTLMQLTLEAWRAARIKLFAVQSAAAAGLILLALFAWQQFNARSAQRAPNADFALGASPTAVEGARVPATDADTVPAAAVKAVTNANDLIFHVVDAESGAPVEKARLTLVSTIDFPKCATNSAMTDDRGTSVLNIDRTPIRSWSSRIEVFRDGYVPKYVSWSQAQRDDPKEIPSEYTTKLARAVEIGGTVLNDRNEVVSGASVFFTANYYQRESSADRERMTLAPKYHVETTDAKGCWRCSHMPQDFSMISFDIVHPNYGTVSFGSARMNASVNLGRSYVAEADLRNRTVTNILKPGLTVAGVVMDVAGNPIPGAKVTQDHDWVNPTANQLTDTDGRFRFQNASLELFELTVQADGYAPVAQRVEPLDKPLKQVSATFGSPTLWTTGRVAAVTANLEREFRFVLTNGAVLRGRILDEREQPVVKANVQICSHSNVRRFEWETTTDENGRFEWSSAPPSPEFYVITAAGYEILDELKWTADGTEHLVRLQSLPPPVCLSGTAIDATTRKPLEEFRVVLSGSQLRHTGYGRAMESSMTPVRVAGTAGRFAFTNSGGTITTYALEVRAKGYWPARIMRRDPMTNDAEFQFELKPGLVLDGKVQSPDGQPAANANAVLCTEEPSSRPDGLSLKGGVYMRLAGQFDLEFSTSGTRTDAEGRFSFEPKFAAKKILVSHETGFAAVPVEQLAVSPLIVLQPWGCVAGVLKIGGRVGGGETITLTASQRSFEEWSGFSVFLETKTDANGHFVFEGVPPGSFRIAHRLTLPEVQTSIVPNSQDTMIQVRAGETTEVTLGGAGRKLVGKLHMLQTTPRFDWRADVYTMTSKTGEPPWPSRDKGVSETDYQAARADWETRQREFWRSESGQKAQRDWRRYVLQIGANGSFLIEDVIPGTYELEIRGSGRNQTKKEIVVPEAEQGAVEPFDVGTIEVN